MLNNTPTFTPLTNRSAKADGARFVLPEDGFIQIVPVGKAPNKRGNGAKIVQLVDESAITAMLNRAIAHGGEMLIDREHESRDSDKRTDAMAWLPLTKETLDNRGADGLWGKPRWTTDGDSIVEGGTLRFTSPEFPDDDSLLEKVSGNIFRPLAIVGCALTNRPSFKTSSKPLTNRGDDTDPNHTNNTDTMIKPIVAALLGITETALDALDETTLKNRVTEIKTRADKAATLETELTTIKNRDAADFIKANDAVIPKDEGTRKLLSEQFLLNRAVAESIVGGFKAAKAATDKGERKPLHNRESASPPADQDADAEANRLHNRALSYVHEHKVSYEQARAAVRAIGDDK